MTSRQRSRIAASGLLLLAGGLAYAGVLQAGFVWDDHLYLPGNPLIGGRNLPEVLAWSIGAVHAANWHPLTWLSHLLDVRVAGYDPRWHHGVNLLLHGVNALLLLRLMAKLTGRWSAPLLAAALFALHPANVESVAWVSQRKTLLAMAFLLGATLAWLRHLRAARGTGARVRWYVLALLLYAASLASKALGVVLPLLLLVLDGWPLGRLPLASRGMPAGSFRTPWPRLLAEKLPFLVLAAGGTAMVFLAQKQGDAVQDLLSYPLGLRLANVPVALVRSLGIVFWPADLAVFYPHPGANLAAPVVTGSVVILAGITFLALALARRRPAMVAGWSWFLVSWLPAAGLVQVGSQALADRYLYLPLVGLLLTIQTSTGMEATGARRRLILPSAVVILALLGWRTAIQTRFWLDDRRLFRQALAVTQGNWLAHHNLGGLDALEGNLPGAEAHYRAAIAAAPSYALAHRHLAEVLDAEGRYDEALEHYRLAAASAPRDAAARNRLGVALGRRGRITEAVGAFEEALALDSGFSPARQNLELARGAAPSGD